MSCCICFNFYDTKDFIPKLLSCGHDGCLDCLNVLYYRKRFVECPVCRVLHRVDPKNLPTVFSLIKNESDRMKEPVSSEPCSQSCEYPNCAVLAFKNSFHCGRSLCIQHYHDDQIVLKRLIQHSIRHSKLHVKCLERDVLRVKKNTNPHSSFEIMEKQFDAMIASMQKRKEELVEIKTESLNALNKSLVTMESHITSVNGAVTELEQFLLDMSDSNEMFWKYKKLMSLIDQAGNSLPEHVNVVEIRAPWEKYRSHLDMSLNSVSVDSKRVMTSSAVLSNLSLSNKYYLKANEVNIMKDEKKPFMIWCLDKVSELRNSSSPIFSPEFITHIGGYKAKMEIYLNGFGDCEEKYVSLFLRMCRHDSDGDNAWPFPWSFVFGIVDQEWLCASLYSHTFAYGLDGDKMSECFQKPKSVYNKSLGLQKFMDIETLNASDSFIRDDKLFVAVVLLK